MWYGIFRITSYVILKILFGLKIDGFRNLPKRNNFIIVANHTSFLDPLVVAAAVPKKIYCIALKGLYKVAWLGWVLPKLDAIPTGDSSEKAIELLLKNNIVGLFPEGARSRDGQLKVFRKGAALLAFKTGRPVVPCAISGAYQALPAGAKLPKLVPIRLKIGKPLYFLKDSKEIIDEVELQAATSKIKNSIKELLDAG